MAGETDWYPSTRPAQRAMYANFTAKIDNYKTTLGLSDPYIDNLKLICATYIAVFDWLNLMESTVDEAYPWRNALEKGDKSDPVQPPPIFAPLALPVGAFNGYVTEFREKVAQIKEMDGYTFAIGTDLMIVKQPGEGLNLNEVQPDFKYEVRPNFKVRVKGSMKGLKSANFYYRRKGQADFVFVNYLQSLPGELTITPAAPGVPEAGDIKAIFVADNAEVGLFSDNTEITLS